MNSKVDPLVSMSRDIKIQDITHEEKGSIFVNSVRWGSKNSDVLFWYRGNLSQGVEVCGCA
jgi:hypothetical protein